MKIAGALCRHRGAVITRDRAQSGTFPSPLRSDVQIPAAGALLAPWEPCSFSRIQHTVWFDLHQRLTDTDGTTSAVSRRHRNMSIAHDTSTRPRVQHHRRPTTANQQQLSGVSSSCGFRTES
ncbi:hypothetical protein EYF80_025552 [Liparis tanakae]|uniref:Uncharacterized protein n=1 Tax=Liparis tanakae TaxID=230148 RepID=A0A4Z2HH06_9TELE|nr:hypothetical protein EYF80_025552 [Liparis tanakae]